jgi:GNAT superfamily N-acetyltransferase
VLPEYQRLGIGVLVLHGVVPKAIDWGIEEAEFSWVLESNSLSRGSLQKGGAKLTKTFRVYDLDEPPGDGKSLAPTRPAALAVAPGKVEIRQVQSAGEINQFAKIPWGIYGEDPQWVPPLLIEVKDFLDPRKHPFYKHGAAAQFLAYRNGVAEGRILASDDPNYNRQHGTNMGCFGMFECPNDPQMAAALLDAAAGWLRQRGRSGIMGPIDYSTNYPCGLLVDGFDSPPRIMNNHNRRYYAGLLESWGLAKAKDLYCWWFADPRNMLERWSERARRLQARGKITIRSFRENDFEAEVERCKSIYNASMHDNWGFVGMTDAEFRYMADRLRKMAQADLVLLAEVEGKPVGFSITLPDVNEAIRPLNGRLTNFGLPINLLRLLRRMRRIKTARMIVLDVLDGYRRRGIAEMLILRTLDFGKNQMHYTGAELGWTLEDNDAVNQTIEAVGAKRYKTYRIYEKKLG